MATQPNITNVTRLPTAAARKVENWRFKEQRQAAMSLRQGNRFADRYVAPCVRAAIPDARLIGDVTISPELLIASALLAVADSSTRAKVAAQLQPAAGNGSKAHNQALAIMRRQLSNIGDSFAFEAARTLIEMEGR